MTVSLADRWYAQWIDRNAPPDLNAFLASHGRIAPGELADLLLVDQQLQWRAGPGPRVEEYLQRFPVLAQDLDGLVDLVYGEFRARRKLGFDADAAQLLARFPQVADRLQKQTEIAGWCEDSAASPRQRGTSSGAVAAGIGAGKALAAGMSFGDYELLETIARGGMGIVYKARHRALDRIVALKMILPGRRAQDDDVQRFQIEVLAMSQLDHPNVMPVYEVGQCDDVSFFTTRYIETGSLDDQSRHFQGEPEKIARTVIAIATAVHHAHQRGVLHRDLKPSNVLIAADGRPLVTDFGLARIAHHSSNLTLTGDLLGTPMWLPPELASRKSGSATIASDVYGIGAILYFLLTGQAPFAESNLLDMLDKVREMDPVAPRLLDPDVSRDLEVICLKAMDKDPARRYSTASLMAEDLERFLNGEPVSARPLPWWERQRRWLSRHPLAAGLTTVSAMAVVLLLLTAAFYTARESRLTRHLSALVSDAQSARNVADRLKREAERLERDAAAIREEATEARRDHRSLLYAAHIREAHEALGSGDVRRADDLLKQQIPRPGLRDLRRFEWYWLRRQCQIGDPILEFTSHNPRCVRFSNDGRWLVLGDSAGSITLIDAATKQRVALWTTSHEMVESVSFSPTADRIATAGHDGTIRVWNLETREVETTFDVPQGHSWRAEFVDDRLLVAANRGESLLLLDSRHPEHSVAISGGSPEISAIGALPDEKLFAALGSDGVAVFDLTTLQPACFIPFSKRKRGGKVVRFSPTGRRLAFDDADRNVHVYELDASCNPRPILIRSILDEVRDVSFSPDATHLAVCNNIGGMQLWSLDEAAEPANTDLAWQAHGARVNAIAYSPTGQDLVSAARDDRVRIWRPASVRQTSWLKSVATPDRYEAGVTFLPRSNTLVAPAEGGFELWDVDQNKLLQAVDPHGSSCYLVAVSPDGEYVATGGPESEAFVDLWQRSENAVKRLWHLDGQACKYLAFSPDSSWVLVADWWNNQSKIVQTATGDPIAILNQESLAASFSPNASQLAMVVLDEVHVYECSTWKLVHQLYGHDSTTTTVTYSPDGQWIASGSKDRSIRLWDVASGREHFRLLGHRDWVEDLVFSPDGQSLVSASRDGFVKVWHVASGKFLCDLWESPVNWPRRMAFSSEGDWLAVRHEHGQIAVLRTDREETR